MQRPVKKALQLPAPATPSTTTLTPKACSPSSMTSPPAPGSPLPSPSYNPSSFHASSTATMCNPDAHENIYTTVFFNLIAAIPIIMLALRVSEMRFVWATFLTTAWMVWVIEPVLLMPLLTSDDCCGCKRGFGDACSLFLQRVVA